MMYSCVLRAGFREALEQIDALHLIDCSFSDWILHNYALVMILVLSVRNWKLSLGTDCWVEWGMGEKISISHWLKTITKSNFCSIEKDLYFTKCHRLSECESSSWDKQGDTLNLWQNTVSKRSASETWKKNGFKKATPSCKTWGYLRPC